MDMPPARRALIAVCAAQAFIRVGAGTYGVAAALALVYGGLIWADSATLTAGATGSARPGQRGATLAVHTTLGYLGGFLGPVVFGVVLDAAGGTGAPAWGLAFAHIAAVLLVGPLALLVLRPADLPGDRGRQGLMR